MSCLAHEWIAYVQSLANERSQLGQFETSHCVNGNCLQPRVSALNQVSQIGIVGLLRESVVKAKSMSSQKTDQPGRAA